MGLSLFKTCSTNESAIAPNPNPSHWKLLEKIEYRNSYILKVKYDGCNNFEGVKVMVFKGKYKYVKILDPHFRRNAKYSPIARFQPNAEGWSLAIEVAKKL